MISRLLQPLFQDWPVHSLTNPPCSYACRERRGGRTLRVQPERARRALTATPPEAIPRRVAPRETTLKPGESVPVGFSGA